MTASASTPRTRIFSFGTLAAFVTVVGAVAVQGYRVATDSFVAPVILSPDSDVVLQAKLKLSELAVERSRVVAELEAIDSDVAACEQAVTRLRALAASAVNVTAWTKSVNAQQLAAGAAEERKLREQHAVLASMLTKQTQTTDDAKKNYEAGLVAKADYVREIGAQNQLELALLENERNEVQVRLGVQQAALGAQSLAAGAGGPAPMMPEVALRQDQAVRIELEVLKLETEQRSKRAARAAIMDKLAKIDEVEAKLKGRPAIAALEHKVNLAFVPYTQSDGVEPGARVLECVWGIAFCKEVGAVASVVPGEVILPDPWGNQARGQYAVLDLRDDHAAKSKTLRVRPSPHSTLAPPAQGPMFSAAEAK